MKTWTISEVDIENIGYRCKDLVENMPKRTGRLPDKADFVAAIEDELRKMYDPL